MGVVVWIGEPFLRRPRPVEPSTTADEQASLLLQKDVLYTAIRDLTFDFHTGKVEQADYTVLRQELEAEAIHVLQSLDTVAWSTAVHEEIEGQVQALRHADAAPLAEGVCRKCQTSLQGTENFCPGCGHAMQLS
jgi:hypothetical protein